MKEGRISHLKSKGRGQAIVEFVIALPILLFVLFGIIEFARMVFAWMAVQNAARFGIRYAVTGEYNEVYCVEAGNYYGAAHINADTFGGDPQDCQVPDDYPGADKNDLERALIDMARLFSIQDAAIGGGTGLWLRPNVSGNYDQYLTNHNIAFVGMPTEEGFYHITTCSNRAGEFAMDYNNYSIPLCVDMLSSQLMDDAGGPGDRVKVYVDHQHPLFLPLLSNLWPSVTLTAERDGIVEKFRTSRVIGVSGPILSAPTWTQTPTITPSPTITPTPTPSYTPTITNTPIPVDCDLISVDYSTVGNLGGFYGVLVRIRNDNPVPIHLYQVDQNWQVSPPSRFLWAMQFNGSAFEILNDLTPPTVWNPSPAIEMLAGGLGDYIALFQPVAAPLVGDTSVTLTFDDSCTKGVSAVLPTLTPTSTPTITSTPTVTPTPDCSRYSMSNFVFGASAMQSLTVSNGDVVNALVNQIQFNWDYAENYGAANGYPDLNVDLFSWNGSNFYLGGNNDGVFDSSSPTNWIGGSLPFNAGSTYTWAIDFDNDWAGGGALTGVVSNDFGVIIDFANGCQLSRSAVPRPIISWTPSLTPTITWTPTPPPPPTATALPTNTFTPSATPLPSFTPTASRTPSKTPTASDTPPATNTSLPSNTPITPTKTNTLIPSVTPSPTTSRTPTPTKSPTPTPIPTWTPACPFDDPSWPCQPTWTPTP
jgi:hypothetical protein